MSTPMSRPEITLAASGVAPPTVLPGDPLKNLEQAKAITGRQLPGPLPARDADPDPATGVTDAEAS